MVNGRRWAGEGGTAVEGFTACRSFELSETNTSATKICIRSFGTGGATAYVGEAAVAGTGAAVAAAAVGRAAASMAPSRPTTQASEDRQVIVPISQEIKWWNSRLVRFDPSVQQTTDCFPSPNCTQSTITPYPNTDIIS